MPRITLTIGPEEHEALVALALAEMRTPRDQARYLLGRELQRELEWRGLQNGDQRPQDRPDSAVAPEAACDV